MQVGVVCADCAEVGLFVLLVACLKKENGKGGKYLKMLHINNIKSHNRRVQPNIRLRNLLSKIVRSLLHLTQMLLRAVQTLEQSRNSFLISFLCGRESGLVDAVVDVVVGPVVCGFDFLL